MYSHRLTICTPVSLISRANSIARSMDPDVGGANSFSSVQATKAGGTYSICDTWVRENFYLQAPQLLSNPSLLHQIVVADYTSRWPDLIAPSLEDCTSFLSSSKVILSVRDSRTLEEILAPEDFTLVPPPLMEI
jgi:hypothetical protein